MPRLRAIAATPYRRGVLVLSLVTVLWRAWTVSRWSWQDDDWVYLADAARMPLGDYVLQLYNGHLMPAQFLLTWAITELAPLDFAVPVVLTALTSGLVVLLWGRAFAALGGERVALLAPLALVSLSPLFIRPTLWWASAIQVLPLQACLAWGVLVAARMARQPTRRDVVELTGALVVALAFWEKSVLLAVPFAMTLLCAHGGRPLQRLRVHARPLLALAATCATYTAGYLALGALSGNQTGADVNFNRTPTPGEAAGFYWAGLGDLMAPAAWGGPWGSLPAPGDFYAAADPVVAVLAVVLLGAAVVATLLRRRGAWFPLAIAAVYTLGMWTLVLTSSRYANIGNVAVRDERYAVDSFSVAVVAVVLCWTGLRRGSPRSRPVPAALPWVVALGLTASLVVANGWAAQRNGTSPASAWLSTTRHQLADASREATADEPLVLVDGTAPDRVLQAAFWGENTRLSRMLAPLAPEVAFRRPAEQVWSLDDSGRLEPARIDALTTSQPGPVEGCGYLVPAGGEVTVPLTQALYHWDWGVEISTFSDRPADLTLELGGPGIAVPLPAGPQVRRVQHTGEVPDHVVVRSGPGDGAVCVTDLRAGTFAPSD